MARGSELSVLPINRERRPLWETSQKTAQTDAAFQESFGSQPDDQSCQTAKKEKQKQILSLQLCMSAHFGLAFQNLC